MRIAVVLFNLGGPDSPDAVEPFLTNLFSDPAILNVPALIRQPLARLIAKRRAPVARDIYAKIGGRSPILEKTEAQGHALEMELGKRGFTAKSFVAMRAWKPFAEETAAAVTAWQPEHLVLLPLYPQYSTTTTGSSLKDWHEAGASPNAKPARVCCYPCEDGFIGAVVSQIREISACKLPGVDYRLLLSAHGLPKRLIQQGDPYFWQVQQTAKAIVDCLGIVDLDWRLCFQSRVGPLEWVGPATDAEIRRAGGEGKGVIVVPIAFVSEHSETLVELDIEYARLARDCGVAHYLRVPTVGAHPAFIQGLANLVMRAVKQPKPVTCDEGRICPAGLARCGYEVGNG